MERHLPSDAPFSGVSIVIPVFNALEYAQECIKSIHDSSVNLPFEVFLLPSRTGSSGLDVKHLSMRGVLLEGISFVILIRDRLYFIGRTENIHPLAKTGVGN